MPRMVKTPWFEDEVPFEKAAEIGTKKVIDEHSTIGIVVTTDGSITDIPREDYIAAEERVVSELKALNKPFIIVLNCEDPYSNNSKDLAMQLEEKYGTPVMPLSCIDIQEQDINEMFSKLLYEFKIDRININFPKWVDGLDSKHKIKQELYQSIFDSFKDTTRLKQINEDFKNIESCPLVEKTLLEEINLGTGAANVTIRLNDELFYQVLTEMSGVNVKDEGDLFVTMSELSKVKKEYDKMAYAIHEVREKGYGIVSPGMDDLILDEPEIVKQGSKFGVKLKAKAPSIHMIKIDTETEVSPIVGSEKQSEELVNYLLSEFENDPKKIWESNIFGKSLHELVNEGLQNKLARMPEDAQHKLQETLQRFVNEGSGGLICIIL